MTTITTPRCIVCNKTSEVDLTDAEVAALAGLGLPVIALGVPRGELGGLRRALVVAGAKP